MEGSPSSGPLSDLDAVIAGLRSLAVSVRQVAALVPEAAESLALDYDGGDFPVEDARNFPFDPEFEDAGNYAFDPVLSRLVSQSFSTFVDASTLDQSY